MKHKILIFVLSTIILISFLMSMFWLIKDKDQDTKINTSKNNDWLIRELSKIDKRCLPIKEMHDRKKTNVKTIYLTFDDGPSTHTNEMIDLLKSEGVVGTFFFTELASKSQKKHQISKNRDLILKAFSNGNMIGNHTLQHDYDVLYKNKKNIEPEVMKNYTLYKNIIKSKYTSCPNINHIFRFPGGSKNYNGTEKYRDYFINWLSKKGILWVDWQVFDFGMLNLSKSANENYKEILKLTNKVINSNQSQVVMITHDFLPYEIEMLRYYIKEMKRRGYIFDIINNQTETFRKFERH